MGDLRQHDGITEHEVSHERWERLLPDACGRPLSVCLHGDEPALAVDEMTGHVVMEIGGQAVMVAPEMAAHWADALLKLVGRSSEAGLRNQHRARREATEETLRHEREGWEAEIATARETLTALLRETAAARVDLAALQKEIAEGAH